jgi:copper(I)-binding protein
MFNKIKTMLLVFIALISFNATFAFNNQLGNITIDDPWVRSEPPNAPILGAIFCKYPMQLTLEINSSEQLSSVCGSFDRHLALISKSLDVTMNNKGEDFTIKGENKHIAARVLQDLIALSASELHKTVPQDGMMKMIKQDFMLISAHSKLTLKPGIIKHLIILINQRK